MYAPERHAEIVARARAEGRVEVTSLATKLRVATETIRRDLTQLERRGLIRRVHGGAIAVERLGLEPTVDERDVVNTDEKEAIARLALGEIADATTIIVDGGTTTSRLAAQLPSDRELTVITHALPVAVMLAGNPRVNLHLIGGAVRGRTLAAVGPWATSAIETLRADVAFIGTNGLTTRGLSTRDVAEAEVKAALVRAARRVVVVADHTKLGRDELITFAPLTSIDTLVTDAAADPELISEVTEAGVEVVRA